MMPPSHQEAADTLVGRCGAVDQGVKNRIYARESAIVFDDRRQALQGLSKLRVGLVRCKKVAHGSGLVPGSFLSVREIGEQSRPPRGIASRGQLGPQPCKRPAAIALRRGD
jgi:hypothetical protein